MGQLACHTQLQTNTHNYLVSHKIEDEELTCEVFCWHPHMWLNMHRLPLTHRNIWTQFTHISIMQTHTNTNYKYHKKIHLLGNHFVFSFLGMTVFLCTLYSLVACNSLFRIGKSYTQSNTILNEYILFIYLWSEYMCVTTIKEKTEATIIMRMGKLRKKRGKWV